MLPPPKPWAQARCPPRRAEPRAQKILPVPQALTKRFPVPTPASCPWYFSLASSPVLSHSSAPPSCPFPSCVCPSGSNSPARSRGDPSPALATGICSPGFGDCSGRDLRSQGAGEGQRSPELRMLQRPSLLPPAYQARGPSASRLPAPHLPNFGGVCAQFPSHGAGEPNPSWLAACLTARHEKHSGFSQGSAGKSCQHQRQHRGAPPPPPCSEAGAASSPGTAPWLRCRLHQHSRRGCDFFFFLSPF